MNNDNFNNVLEKLKESGIIYKKDHTLKKGYLNLFLSPLIPEVKNLKSYGMPLKGIREYLIHEHKLPDFISLDAFYLWYRNIKTEVISESISQGRILENKEKQIIQSKEVATSFNSVETKPKVIFEQTAKEITPFSNIHTDVLKPNKTTLNTKIILNNDDYHEEPEINRILAYRAKLLRNDHFMNVSEKCWFERINYEIEIRKRTDFWNQAIEKETEVEILDKTKERNFVRCPQKLWTLNPHSPRYPFFAISNYLLHDENGIIYTANEQLPIISDFTLYPISFDRSPSFISIDYSLFEENISIYKLEYKLKDYFQKNGQFAQVHKLLDV
jgi:hypothetical protein